MKAVFCFLFFALLYCSGYAQVNYVLNPGFEQYTQCPYEINQIAFANYWNGVDTVDIEPFCAPEYCNACSTQWGMPANPGGFYFHYARTGTGMVHSRMFYDEMLPGTSRDYMQGHLIHSLAAGISYCVCFYVVLTDNSCYGINHVGAYLDNGAIDTATINNCADVRTQYIPQVYGTNIITDTLNWTKIEGSFVANGTERFITIGNFFDKAHTNYVAVKDTSGLSMGGSAYTYFLVDDVSVIPSNTPAYAGHDTTIYAGDSAYVGRTDLMPDMKWHLLGSNTVIDSSAGFWAHPAQTTTYIVQQTLCGLVKYDTVKITVQPHSNQGVSNIAGNDIKLYPNPAKDVLSIAYPNLNNAEVVITDMAGRILINQVLPSPQNKQAIDIHALSPGLYLYKITRSSIPLSTGKIVKE